jgi:hypothetical protein
MKKLSVSFIAIVLASALFAFTSKKFADGDHCNESLYWFQVNVTNKTCSQVLQTMLIPIDDADNNGVLNSLDFITVTAATHPYGCADTDNNACALGFLANQIERIGTPGSYQFRPILAQVPLFRCCVKRPIVP